MSDSTPQPQPHQFKAETRQLLDILIHSLYTEREIFLRELISNASDALTRISFEMLTNHNVIDPEADLAIHIEADAEKNTLTIRDSGIGMTAEEMNENLGTIAHSGARAFVSAAQKDTGNMGDIIGQFGVGFYSAFMVAESIRVISRSYQPTAQAASWFCSGEDTFTIEPATQDQRGTTIILNLKDDAKEFLQEFRLREIIRKHSEFIAFPIYLYGKPEQVNRQTALWRQSPRKTEKTDYEEFYHQLTLEHNPPLTYTHLAVDAPVQMYAILYVPSKSEHGMFSLRKDDGLKLYSRNILIQEYCRDLLPDYFRFIQGVVDSEDIPLNVSRESYQVSRVIGQLKKLITTRVIDTLEKLSQERTDDYAKLWGEYGLFIKEGVATDVSGGEDLFPLLRFHTTTQPDGWSSFDDYCSRMLPEQTDIYFLLGDDIQSISQSPHLDYLRKHNLEVILLTDPVDSFMLFHLKQFKAHPLKNIAASDLQLPVPAGEPSATPEVTVEIPAIDPAEWLTIITSFKEQLGSKVSAVRITDRLSDSPARLVDSEGATAPEMQRVYRLLREDVEVPLKVLELNPQHPIIQKLSRLPAGDPLAQVVIDQVYENALLIEGLHPDPASMIARIHQIIQAALT